MRTLRAILVTALVALAAAGCGGKDVCDRAVEVAVDHCEVQPENPEEQPACAGDHREKSECIVDHPDEYCEFRQDPVAFMNNEYARCVAAARRGEDR